MVLHKSKRPWKTARVSEISPAWVPRSFAGRATDKLHPDDYYRWGWNAAA
jgi:hypothetical protein